MSVTAYYNYHFAISSSFFFLLPDVVVGQTLRTASQRRGAAVHSPAVIFVTDVQLSSSTHSAIMPFLENISSLGVERVRDSEEEGSQWPRRKEAVIPGTSDSQ